MNQQNPQVGSINVNLQETALDPPGILRKGESFNEYTFQKELNEYQA
jgi:hypothetical protein